MNIFAHAIDDLFAEPNLARDAIFRPAGSGDVHCRVILRGQDVDANPFGVDVIAEGTVIEVRSSEVTTPTRGDSFIIDAATYTLNAAPRRDDPDRLIWTCSAVEEA